MRDLRSQRRRAKPILNGWLAIPDPLVTEVMARQGFHSLCIDMQHGLVDFAHLVPMLQAIGSSDAVPLVRVPSNDPAAMMKVLDAGAWGVIVPLVNMAQEAARAVSSCRYPPVGNRSYGPTRVSLAEGSGYYRRANDEVLVFVMIETREGLENLDDIASTPGLDGLYIGPADLSLGLGLEPKIDNDHPEHAAAVARIVEACRRNDLIAGLHCNSVEFAQQALSRGVDLVTIATDIKCLREEAARRVAACQDT